MFQKKLGPLRITEKDFESKNLKVAESIKSEEINILKIEKELVETKNQMLKTDLAEQSSSDTLHLLNMKSFDSHDIQQSSSDTLHLLNMKSFDSNDIKTFD